MTKDISASEAVIFHAFRTIARYSIAIVTTAFATAGRAALHPWLDNECEFSLFYLSIIATAWIAGSGPAVLSILLGTLAAAHFFIVPASSLYIDEIPDLVQLCIFVIVNVVATLLFDRLHRQRRLAETRSEENRRLSESLSLADERKDEFLALLAHELRNPLAPIRSSLAVLDRKHEQADAVLRVRDVIRRQCNHLVRLTDDLLDVSRFCRGKLTLQLETLDLREPIQDAIELVESLMSEKRHNFQRIIPVDPVWVQGDRVRLAQAISNLLGNAAKFTPVEGRISLDVETLRERVSINVIDNGIGFSPDEAERIRLPFAQVDGSRTREYGGLGLGLSIVSRLITLHHGEFEIFSRGPGRGSRFTINLPVLQPTNVDRNESTNKDTHGSHAASQETPESSQATLESLDLLIVEDNDDASSLLSELFQSEGFSVRTASNGIEALQLVADDVPDVVLLDIGLPGMDGFEIAKRMRRLSALNDTRIIALTGWGSPVDRQLATECGFDLHLVKPVRFFQLLAEVRSVKRCAESSLLAN